jgi:hypothetical protein
MRNFGINIRFGLFTCIIFLFCHVCFLCVVCVYYMLRVSCVFYVMYYLLNLCLFWGLCEAQ